MSALLVLGIVFLVIAFVAFALGARGIAGFSASIGRTFLFVFLILAIVMFIIYAVHPGAIH